jgi:O-antigen/teichoic acid export membrane protein
MTLFLLVHSDLTGRGKAKITFMVFSFALLINVLLNVLLIPQFGINGAAMASSVSYSVGAIWLCFFFAKETGLGVSDILFFKREDYFKHIAPAINKFLKR